MPDPRPTTIRSQPIWPLHKGSTASSGFVLVQAVVAASLRAIGLVQHFVPTTAVEIMKDFIPTRR